MIKARFVLDKKKVIGQYNKLKDLGVRVSYSLKTNKEVGKILEEETDSEFAIHHFSEIELFDNQNMKKLWFFSQAWSSEEIGKIIATGVRSFVVDNEADLDVLLEYLDSRNNGLSNKSTKNPDYDITQKLGNGGLSDLSCKSVKINLLLRMKFQEHRISSGKYFTYGLSARKVNEIIGEIAGNLFIDKLGVHIHRKSQNASEWEIKSELEDSLSEEALKRIDIINLGGGFPVKYRTYTSEVLPYIFGKVKEVKTWLESERKGKKVEVYVEPGRFIAGPAVKLEAEVLQVYDGIVVINTSIYNCSLDSVITDIRLLIEGELDDSAGERKEGFYYKIKGNTPTRDDIFRYRVKLGQELKVGDKIVFLNAGAYNYTTDFCSLEKLETVVV